MKKQFTISYSHNREDIILQGFFAGRKSKPGFYVDVGAGHFSMDSVTKLFYDNGWHGINIDPINHIYKALQLHRRRDVNLNIGISNIEGSLHFREYATDGYSTFSTEMQSVYEATPDRLTDKYLDYDVPTRTLAHVLEEYKATDIQFLKIDVEGYEYEVVASNDWKSYRPEVLCIEANHVKKDWRPILRNNGYVLTFFDGLNEYYVDQEKAEKIKFSYVDAVISREPILRYDGYEIVRKQEEELEQSRMQATSFERQSEELTFKLQAAQNRIEHLHKTLPYIKARAGRVVSRVQTRNRKKAGGS